MAMPGGFPGGTPAFGDSQLHPGGAPPAVSPTEQSNSVRAPGGMGSTPLEERQLTQWGYLETTVMIALREEKEREFAQGQANSRNMWESISAAMRERGYRRTPRQCKSKWRLLVQAYQAKDGPEYKDGSLPPFYEELDAILNQRARNMERMLMQAQGQEPRDAAGTPGLSRARPSAAADTWVRGASPEDEEGGGMDAEDWEGYGASAGKRRRGGAASGRGSAPAEVRKAGSVQEVIEQFFAQQLRLQHEWRSAAERREAERGGRERQWCERMEQLERERSAKEEEWRRREEERWAQEDAHAERQNQLLAALIEKLG